MWLYKNTRHKQIKKILNLILKIWKQHPELRLCQLLSNCFSERDLYYISDKDLEESLINTYIIEKDHELKS